MSHTRAHACLVSTPGGMSDSQMYELTCPLLEPVRSLMSKCYGNACYLASYACGTMFLRKGRMVFNTFGEEVASSFVQVCLFCSHVYLPIMAWFLASFTSWREVRVFDLESKRRFQEEAQECRKRSEDHIITQIVAVLMQSAPCQPTLRLKASQIEEVPSARWFAQCPQQWLRQRGRLGLRSTWP